MYRVTVKNGNNEYPLHHFAAIDEQIYGDTLSEEMGKTPTFVFQVPPTNPNLDKINTLSSRILVYDDDTLVFEGRAVSPQADLYNSGSVSCVGALSFLADSMIAPKTYAESISAFVSEVVGAHNAMVETGKRFTVGTVNVAGRSVSLEAGSYMDALSLLNAGLEGINGYLHVRYANGVRYLDYTYNYGDPNTQKIRFGENMLDITRQKNGAEIITCLIPEGAEVEVENPDGTVTRKRIDIKSVTSGAGYIANTEGVAQYGQIWGHAVFDEITTPQALLTAAQAYLTEKVALPETIEVRALDLHLTDSEIAKLRVGCMTGLVSEVHGVEGTYLLSKRETHITAPQNDTITFGAVKKTVSGAVSSNAHDTSIRFDEYSARAMEYMQDATKNATSLITGGQGGYIVFGLNATDGHPEEIFIMDSPSKAQAVHVIRLNRNGIGFSTNGISGPYTNAWTIDGNLVADFITTGSMLANRIRGGTLELGGQILAQAGKIRVLDSGGNEIGVWDRTGLEVKTGTITGSKVIVDGRLAPEGYEEDFYDDVIIEGEETQEIGDDVDPADVLTPEEAEARMRDGKSDYTGAVEVYDKNGDLIGRWDSDGIKLVKGDIEGVNIKGSEVIIGGTDDTYGRIEVLSPAGNTLFRASRSGVLLGGFKVYQSDQSGATYFSLDDESVGMGDHENYAIWAGSSGDDPPFQVTQDGKLYCEDMGPDWAGYSVGEAIKWIWDHWPGPEAQT